MPNDSGSKLFHAAAQCADLDEAIELCILELERGETDPRELLAAFPQWQTEIGEFLQDWGGMENYATQLIGVEDSSAEEADLSGTRIGDYELMERIGDGGMGVIYRARQASLDRFVAVKVLRGHRRDRQRFNMEAGAAAALSHPNIVQVYETGEHDGQLYFSMQLIDGCNLKEFLDSRQVSQETAAQIALTLANAVHYAHQRGILHRDLKPANVMMDTTDEPHVTDFGLAKQLERETEITHSGTILGTPGYMAPEQAAGNARSLTTATDVYGLGAILYAMLTGDAPFAGDSSLEVLRRVIDEEPQSPRIRNPQLHRDLETICLKCLEKEPDKRYGSAEQLARDLTAFLNHQPVKARPITAMARCWRWCRRNPSVAALSVAVVALLVATTLASVFLAMNERESRIASQKNRRKESELNQQLGRVLEQATLERVNLLNTNGLWQASEQNAGEAALWFSAAANLKNENGMLIHEDLIHLQSWLQQHPALVDACLLERDYLLENSNTEIWFAPDDEALLYRSGRQFFLWNLQEGMQWHLSRSFPQIMSAVWGDSGNTIFMALRDGQILKGDVRSRQTTTVMQLEPNVLEVAWVNHRRWLAISNGRKLQFIDVESAEFAVPEVNCKLPIRKLVPDETGEQLAVVFTDNNSAAMYQCDALSVQHVFDFSCRSRAIRDDGYLLWPLFIKQGKSLLARHQNERFFVLDCETGESLAEVQAKSPVFTVQSAPSGDDVVFGQYNQAIHVRIPPLRAADESNLPTLAPEGPFWQRQKVNAIAISPSGLIASGGQDSQVRLWKTLPVREKHMDFDYPEMARTLAMLPHQNQIRSLAFSADGKLLCSVQMDGLMRVWRVTPVQSAGYHIEVASGGSLVKSVDERGWLLSGMSRWTGHVTNASIQRWQDGAFVAGCQGETTFSVGHLIDSQVSPDGSMLATVHAGPGRSGSSFGKPDGAGGVLRMWTLPDCEPLGEPIAMPAEPRWIEFHPSLNQLTICTCFMDIVTVDCDSWGVEVWESRRRKSLFPGQPLNEEIRFDQTGDRLLTRSVALPGIDVWDYSSRTLLYRFENEGLAISDFDLAPASTVARQGSLLAIAGGRRGVVEVLDLDSGQPRAQPLEHPADVNSVRFSRDGQLLVTSCSDGHARVFDWQTGQCLLDQLNHASAVAVAEFSPDAKWIATVGEDNQLRIWKASDGSLALRPFTVPEGSAQLVFSPDSRQVVVSGGQILVADLSSLQSDPQLSLAQARQISELLSNRSITDGSIETLSPGQWMDRWQAYQRIQAERD